MEEEETSEGEVVVELVVLGEEAKDKEIQRMAAAARWTRVRVRCCVATGTSRASLWTAAEEGWGGTETWRRPGMGVLERASTARVDELQMSWRRSGLCHDRCQQL